MNLKILFLFLLFVLEKVPSHGTDVPADCVTDTLFLLDSSHSVLRSYNRTLGLIRQLIQGLNVSARGNRIGIMIYSGKQRQFVRHGLNQSQDSDVILRKIDQIPFLNGATSTGAALGAVVRELANRQRRMAQRTNVVVFTDGFSFDSTLSPSTHLHTLDPPKLRIFAVSLDTVRNDSELLQIAGGLEMVFVGDVSAEKLAQKLMECEEGQGEGEQQKFGQQGTSVGEEQKSAIHHPSYDFPGPQLGSNCSSGVDIVFLLDTSGSVRQTFGQQKTFLSDLLAELSTDGSARVGLISFRGRGRSRVMLPLNSHLSPPAIRQLITNSTLLTHFGGTTFIGEALEKAQVELEEVDQGKGQRAKLVVVFTDGLFQDEDLGQVALNLRQNGILLVTISADPVKSSINVKQLELLTGGEPGRTFLGSRGKDQLKQFMQNMPRKCRI